MAFSRREFMHWAASTSALAIALPGRSELLPLLGKGMDSGFHANLLPSQKTVWDWQVWMAKLGPKYTGNKAHTDYVEFLATQFKALNFDVSRDHFTFPRWDARRWGITVMPASGASYEAPVTSYFPRSGQTPAAGVTGDLVYAGTAPLGELCGVARKNRFCGRSARAEPLRL